MGIAPAGDWDARAAIQAVLGGAPELRRHIVLADLALRLARLGHVKSVRVDIAGGPEAAKAVRSVLSQLATPPQAAADLDVAAEAVIPLADRSDAVPGPTHALVSVQKRAKATLTGVASGAQVTLPDVARDAAFAAPRSSSTRGMRRFIASARQPVEARSVTAERRELPH